MAPPQMYKCRPPKSGSSFVEGIHKSPKKKSDEELRQGLKVWEMPNSDQKMGN